MAKKKDESDPWLYIVWREDGIEVEMHPTRWTEIGARKLERGVRAVRRQRMRLRKQAIVGGGTYVRRFREERGSTDSEGTNGHPGEPGQGT